jgi:hypothetical protein
MITFTRKRDIRGLKEPTLFSKTIQLSTEVKYLRLTLDNGLEEAAGLGNEQALQNFLDLHRHIPRRTLGL